MNLITCKAQWLARPMTTKTSMDGFEGPASRNDIDDGFGNPMIKGQKTATYNCFFKVTGKVDNSEVYDGTIDIPDTRFNREKIAAHVRGRDLRVVDRGLERTILAENPPGARKARIAAASAAAEMPEDFDGSKVVLRTKVAMKDADPVEDPHADAVFTEVPKVVETAPVEAPENPELPIRKTSLGEFVNGLAPKPVTEPPKGIDPKAAKAKAPKAPDNLTPDIAE